MAHETASENAIQAKVSALRLLILSLSTPAQTTPLLFPSFLQSLTGTSPSPDLSIFAGYTSHPPLHLKTKYYDIDVGIWCDELPRLNAQSSSSNDATDSQNTPPASNSNATSLEEQSPIPSSEPQPTLSEWQEQMLSTPAHEVRDVIGGIVVLVPFGQQVTSTTSATEQSDLIATWIPYIEAATELRNAIEDESGRDVASIMVLQDMSPTATDSTDTLLEKTEEECLTTHGIIGWDFVHWQPTTETPVDTTTTSTSTPKSHPRNQFGEKSGFPRVFEVLEGIDWTAGPSGSDADDNLEDVLGSDPLVDFLDDAPNSTPSISITTEDPHDYSNLNKGVRADMRSTPGKAGTMHPGSETERLLAQEQHSFQREMLGLKMAMMDRGDKESGPSSMAGELDISDIGARTPAPASQLTELATSGSGSGSGGDTANVRTGGGDDEDGGDVQVEQLTGLMERVVAMREAAQGLPDREKERFARREVNRIMKELG